VRATSQNPMQLCLVSTVREDTPCRESAHTQHDLAVPLPPVELILPDETAREGSQVEGLKIIAQEAGERTLTLVFDAPTTHAWKLKLRRNSAIKHLNVEGATANEDGFTIEPKQTPGASSSYQVVNIRISW